MTDHSQKFTLYNPDGSMTSEYRQQLRDEGYSEDQINYQEQEHKRRDAVEKEQAYWKEKHRKDGEEWDRQYQAQKQEKERLGIKPTFEVLYVSPDKINPNDMNPSQRRSYEMSGLSTEELLSQGLIDLDDLTHSGEKPDDKNPPPYKADPNTPDIPF